MNMKSTEKKKSIGKEKRAKAKQRAKDAAGAAAFKNWLKHPEDIPIYKDPAKKKGLLKLRKRPYPERFVKVYDTINQRLHPCYYISNYGNVISFKDPDAPQWLATPVDNNGYQSFSVSRGDDTSLKVHRTVYYSFMYDTVVNQKGTFDNLLDVCTAADVHELTQEDVRIHHKDKNPSNNMLSNLELDEVELHTFLHKLEQAKNIEKELELLQSAPLYQDGFTVYVTACKGKNDKESKPFITSGTAQHIKFKNPDDAQVILEIVSAAAKQEEYKLIKDIEKNGDWSVFDQDYIYIRIKNRLGQYGYYMAIRQQDSEGQYMAEISELETEFAETVKTWHIEIGPKIGTDEQV